MAPLDANRRNRYIGPRRRRGKLTDAERRRRDEQFIPLEVGRLEERRVLAATPIPGL